MPPRRKTEAVREAPQSRSGKYLHKIKVTDPEKYKCYLAKEAARNKSARSRLTQETKNIQREKTRLRVQRLRERRRAEKQNKVRLPFEKKIKEMSREERKEYDRVRKAESRARMDRQEKRRVRKREQKYRDNRTAKKKLLVKIKTEEQHSDTSSGDSKSAKK